MAGKKSKQTPKPAESKIEKPKQDKSAALGSVKAQPDIVEKPEIITVIGCSKAEDLQKSGYRNISATKIGTDDRGMTIKEYKFIKE